MGLGVPCNPAADDIDIVWEAFFVAGLNQRFNAIDALLARGFPIDYTPWDMNLLHWAVGNLVAPVVEHLVKRGADLDVRNWHPNQSARELAESHYQNSPDNPNVRRIYELCTGKKPA